jgi:hypothetical protein
MTVAANYSLYVIGGQQLCSGYNLRQPDGRHVDCIGNCATGRGYCVAEGSRCLNCVLWDPVLEAGEILCSAFGTPQGGVLPGTVEWPLAGCKAFDLPPVPLAPPPAPATPPVLPPALQCAHAPGWEYALELIDDPLENDIPDDIGAIAAGFANPNAYFIGNRVIEELALGPVQLCHGRVDGTHPDGCMLDCHDVLESNAGYGLTQGTYPSISTLSSRLKQLIGCFTGQCPANDVTDSWFWVCDEAWCETSVWGEDRGVHWSEKFVGQPFTIPPHTAPNTGSYVAGIGGWAGGINPCTAPLQTDGSVLWHVWGGQSGMEGLTLFSGPLANLELGSCTASVDQSLVLQIRYKLVAPPPPLLPPPPPPAATLAKFCPQTTPPALSVGSSFGCHTSSAMVRPLPRTRATMSSSFGAWLPDYCIDGDISETGSERLCHTQVESSPWIQIELSAVYFVSYVQIHNRADCCQHQLGSADIWISADTSWPGTSSEAEASGFSHCGTLMAALGSPGSVYELKISCGQMGR